MRTFGLVVGFLAVVILGGACAPTSSLGVRTDAGSGAPRALDLFPANPVGPGIPPARVH